MHSPRRSTNAQIATTFIGVHLLTSYSSPPDTDDDAPNPAPTPNNASPTASLTVHLPSLHERTPLLIPTALGTSPSLYSYSPRRLGGIDRRASSRTVREGDEALLPRVRVVSKRGSGEFRRMPAGFGSQAGFLLLGSTPPERARVLDEERGSSGLR